MRYGPRAAIQALGLWPWAEPFAALSPPVAADAACLAAVLRPLAARTSCGRELAPRKPFWSGHHPGAPRPTQPRRRVPGPPSGTLPVRPRPSAAPPRPGLSWPRRPTWPAAPVRAAMSPTTCAHRPRGGRPPSAVRPQPWRRCSAVGERARRPTAARSDSILPLRGGCKPAKLPARSGTARALRAEAHRCEVKGGIAETSPLWARERHRDACHQGRGRGEALFLGLGVRAPRARTSDRPDFPHGGPYLWPATRRAAGPPLVRLRADRHRGTLR